MKIHDVEQGTDEWYDVRVGVPTASEFRKVFTDTGKESTSLSGYAARLAAEKYAEAPLEKWEGNQWTDRGKELEDEARAVYELTTDYRVQTVGFITCEAGLGCSPDGLVGDSGLVEIKCLSPEKHVQALDYMSRKQLPPPEYLPQIYGQMLITGRIWCDFYLYHPVLPTKRLRVTPSDVWIAGFSKAVSKLMRERDAYYNMLVGAA
jgi:hypothetical protein